MTATPTAATTPEELAARLRKATYYDDNDGGERIYSASEGICDEAADLIEAQRAEIERLKAENAALGVRHGIAKARAATAEAALAAMTADRDDWERQASNRTDDAVEAFARAEKAEAALAKVTAEREKDEAVALQLIDQRDTAENALGKLFAMVTGRPPEWSNLFGYSEALDECEAALSASLERERAMREALTKPGVLLFLDGRNEHGTHVLPLPMQTADVSGDDLDEQAEAITKAAEDAGYPVGSTVWCEFCHIKGQYDGMGRCEIAPGFEFVGIDPLLTEIFGGRQPEDDAALAAKETTDAA